MTASERAERRVILHPRCCSTQPKKEDVHRPAPPAGKGDTESHGRLWITFDFQWRNPLPRNPIAIHKSKSMRNGHTRHVTRKKSPTASLVRSSAAEYLTFVAATGSQEQSVEMRYEDENIWLSQKMMAALYDVTVPAINQHLKRIFDDRELVEERVIKHCLTTAADGINRGRSSSGDRAPCDLPP